MARDWWIKSGAGRPQKTGDTVVNGQHLRVLLYGQHAAELRDDLEEYANLEVVDEAPDVVISYGGDGTLLAAEISYPGVPKVPILNSRRGYRCIPHPADEVLARLADGTLVSHEYLKLQGTIRRAHASAPERCLRALNELNVHMGRINTAVRFQVWVDGLPYADELEILGDGFVVCTPFGSTAYYNQITRGLFTRGIGVAFKYTAEHTNHMVLPEDTKLRVLITRGPAVLAYDSADEFYPLGEGDALEVERDPECAIILACASVQQPHRPF